MRIIHIITCLDDGGAEAVLYRLCKHDTADHHTVVSLRGDGKYGPMLRALGVDVHHLWLTPGRANIGQLARLWLLLRQEKPDLVQTWMYHADLIGGAVARLAGVRSVVWGIHHTTLERGQSKRTTMLVAGLSARLSRWVPRRIVCCAESSASVHADLGYSQHKLVVVQNGYDLTSFHPDPEAGLALRRELGIPGEMIVIGMVARFDPQKDHYNLLDALSRLLRSESKAVHCLLIGQGVDRANKQLMHWVEHLGLGNYVVPLGRRSDIPSLMSALDLHVLSSYGEAFPNVLAEAMACGVPCVATEVGDAARIIGSTGWVVPPKDAEALKDGLVAAIKGLSDRESWKKRQLDSRRRIQDRFSIETMVERYREVWDHATIQQ